MEKLTKKMRRLLEWLDGKAVLESQIVASGLSATLNEALRNAWADIADAGVKERSGVPAAAFTITAAGREALAKATP